MKQGYQVHGVHLRVCAPRPFGDVLHDRLRAFAAPDVREADLVVRVQLAPTEGLAIGRPERGGRPVYDRPGAEVLYWDDRDLLWLEEPGLVVKADLAAGEVQLRVSSDRGPSLWLATHGAFTLPLLDGLRRHHLYNVHAGAVAAPAGALLLAGTSGAGKTTLTLALARQGLGLLGDDTVLLTDRNGSLRVLAVPDEVDVTPGTRDLLPWLHPLTPGAPPAGWPKWPLRPERLPVPAGPAELTAAALLLPRVTGGSRTSVVPVEPAEALLQLLPDVLLTRQDVVEAHVALLARLTQQVPAYRVNSGRDLAEVVDAVAAVVL